MASHEAPRKSYASITPLTKYILDHSLRLHESQKYLIDLTMAGANIMKGMLGSSDELQLLANICKSIQAKKTLDIGVFTGYSALTIALVLPTGGKVVACDYTDKYLEEYCVPAWTKGGVRDKIEFHKGEAVKTLEELLNKGEAGTFDFAFIDADKPNYLNYYELCMKLVRPGGIIALDNVIWSGRVIDTDDNSEGTVAIRAVNDHIAKDDRVDVSMLAVGDGVTLCFKK